jgi:hypothetical protein
MRTLLILVAVMAFVSVMPAVAVAQAAGSVEGQVLSSALNLPVAAAQITVMLSDSSRHTTTDEQGRFRITGLTVGGHVLRVEQLGYLTWEGRVVTAPGEVTRVSIILEPAPLVLDSIVGVARTAASYLDGFWERRERNIGYYFTRAEIERARVTRMGDLFRRIPGARIVSTGVGGGHVVSFGRLSSNTVCAAAVYLDGRPYEMSMAGLGDFRLEDVEAIEVYSGPSRIPAQFNATGRAGRSGVSIAGSPHCGVIVIWTRRM